MKKYFYILLFFVLFYAIFLRFYYLWFQSFWIDEGYSSIVSYFANLNNFIPKLPTWIYDFSQYFWTIFQVISFKLFWLSDFSARFFSVILNILTWLIVLLFTSKLINWQKWDKNNIIVYLTLLIVAILFYFSNWEIIWARQARFYSLLAFLFILITYLLFEVFILKNKKYFRYLMIFLPLWLIFHPFLWSLWVVFLIYFWYQLFEDKKIDKREIIWLFVWAFIFLIFKFIFFYFSNKIWIWVHPVDIGNLSNWYIKYYNIHLIENLWIVYILFFIWMIILLYKIPKIGLFFLLIWFINFYVITHKWIMFHTRYVFHLYSIIFIVSWYLIFSLIKSIFKKNKYIYGWLWIIILFLLFFTYKFNFLPKKEYFIDFTSPQPNFKWAYKSIENYSWNIISWFSHMCLWYQKTLKWEFNCKYWLRVDLTWYPGNKEKLLKIMKDRYTWMKYYTWDSYTWFVFVLDDLSLRRNLNKNLIWKVLKNCKLIYKSWKRYDFIWVWKCE